MFKTRQKPIIILIILTALAAGGWYAWAQSVSDSYNDTTKIAATWNVSTSTAGEIKLATRTCDALNWFCTASTTCANDLGDGQYIIVKQADETGSKAWKNSSTNCVAPQCSMPAGEDGDNLKADNTVDYSSYAARDACKAVGGRLPTKTELSCIYTNRATFGGNFGTGNYWSSTEYSATSAYFANFSTGGVSNSVKTSVGAVRCVKGW